MREGNGSRCAKGGAYPGVGSYSNPRISPGWRSNTFNFSQTTWIIDVWTCLTVSPSCSMVTNCETGGRSVEFSPKLSVGEFSCSTSKSSTTLHLPLSLRFEASDLASTILPRFPTDDAKLFRKETGWGRTEAQTYVWLTQCWYGDDDVFSIRDLQEGLPWVFFLMKAPPTVKSIFRREII